MPSPQGLIVTAIPSSSPAYGDHSGYSSGKYDFFAETSSNKCEIFSNGQVIWSMSGSYPTAIAGTDDGIVYIAWCYHGYGENAIQAYNFLENKLLWSVPGGVNSHWLQLDSEGNLIYVKTELGFRDSSVVKLNPSTGETIWEVKGSLVDIGGGAFTGDNYALPLNSSLDSYYVFGGSDQVEFIRKISYSGTIDWTAFGSEISGVVKILEVGSTVYCLRQGNFSDVGTRPGIAISSFSKATGDLIDEWKFSYQDLGFSESLTNGASGLDMSVDVDGNLIIAGNLYTHFDAGVGDSQIFLSSIAQNGIVNWSQDFGGNGSEGVGSRGNLISIQPDGSIAVYVASEGTTDLYGTTLASSNNFLLFKFQQEPGIFVGTDSRDLITATDGSDQINGGKGNDIIDGGSGIDTADYSDKAAAVSVILNGTNSVSVSVGGTTEDTIKNIENLVGGSGNDSFTGDAQANVFVGGAGNDAINGGAGIDTADYSDKSNAVSVTLSGSTAAIVKIGSTNEDTLRNVENIIGGSGNDSLTGDGLANTFTGGEGNDVFKGGAGIDSLNGGIGIDTADFSDKTVAVVVTLNGSTQVTVNVGGVAEDKLVDIENITGGSASDTLVGDANANALSGGNGNDILKGGVGADSLDGGASIDTADYSDKTKAVEVILSTSTAVDVKVDSIVEDSIRNIENIIGGSGNDSLTGDGLANTFTGGEGDDTFKGAAGIDTLLGGAGVDTVDFSDKTTAVVATLNGATQITVTVGGTAEDRLADIENLIGGSGNDTFNGDAKANSFKGGNGNDTFKGGGGADKLDGGANTDTADYSDKTLAVVVTLAGASESTVTIGGVAEDALVNIENVTGGSGNDILTGSSLANVLNGGNGNDVLKGADGIDTLNGGAGMDTVDFSDKSANVVVTLNGATVVTVTVGGVAEDRISNIENVVGGSGNDTLTGDGLANVFTGGLGNDTLNGGTGIDTADYSDKAQAVLVTLNSSTAATVTVGSSIEDSIRNIENVTGGSGNDVLTGDGLANVLSGGSGADTLNGGAGRDTLNGGSDADQFRFTTALNASTNTDTIQDFTTGVDKIGLSSSIFVRLAGGISVDNLRVNATGTAGDNNDYLIFNITNKTLYYDADGNGSGAAIAFAVLTGVTSLTNADFSVV